MSLSLSETSEGITGGGEAIPCLTDESWSEDIRPWFLKVL